MNIVQSIKNLTIVEKIIWFSSLLVIFVSSAIFPNQDWLSVATSLVGATALIFVGKGDPIGQLITIIFSVMYAIVSWQFNYYGEMITYLGMTAPAALWALITWLRNPYSKQEVKVAAMTAEKWILLFMSAVIVTVAMYYVLQIFNTANLLVSTMSITTSVAASMLMIMRSPYYALFYATNDIVLIILWLLATIVNIGFLPMLLCFIIFFVNDIYGFINWRNMKKRQSEQLSKNNNIIC